MDGAMILLLLRVVLQPRFTQLFYFVPRTSAARTAWGGGYPVTNAACGWLPWSLWNISQGGGRRRHYAMANASLPNPPSCAAPGSSSPLDG